MSNFELYLHGTPKGHQIWGSEKNHDYISTFYNHDAVISDKAAIQIDIYMGDSYYTFIHQQNVHDASGRPGSFFAITVSFPKSYCTNVYKLYQIFDAVYRQVCIGTLITQQQNKEVFLVSDFESSHSGNGATVEKIRAIFVKNIAELIEPYMLPLGNVADTFNKEKKQFSLPEVDSPLFFDYFKRQSITVLPNLEPAAIANQTLTKQLSTAVSQKKALESEKLQLQTENAQLQSENQSLSSQLHQSASASDKKYSATINQLKAELKTTAQERDKLKAKIEEAKSSIELIDKPVQKLTRLLAGRFPEMSKNQYADFMASSKDHSQKNQVKARDSRLNSILLGIIICLCVIILGFVAFGSGSTDSKPDTQLRGSSYQGSSYTERDIKETQNKDNVRPTATYTHETTKSPDNSSKEKEKVQDVLSECYIDISSGKIETINKQTYIYPDQSYTLSLMKKGADGRPVMANVDDGEWLVIMDENQPILNEKNTFSVSAEDAGKNLLIKYKTRDGKAKTRSVTVK
ncbi:MAG: hypothetical protein K2M79_05990 [Muribaculaceae bacterium]|nr:hypothetical protein [Muribaculaceae bacterium]